MNEEGSRFAPGMMGAAVFAGARSLAARYLHQVCPSAMIFIPCHLGITHNEAESITSADARVLTEVLLELANT